MYFDNVEHDRFGSIRQQVWTLLHFVLHLAILLTVEGQTALVLWEACRRGIIWFEGGFPSVENPATGFSSTTDLVAAVNKSISDTGNHFYYAPLSDYYDPTPDIAKLQDITDEFASSDWNETTSEILATIKANIEYFIFNNFQAEASEEELDATKDIEKKVEIFNDAFQVVFEYFYIAAGCLLLVLAVMYWFGKTKKRADEWASIGARLLVGMALPCVSAVAFLEKNNSMTDFRFTRSGWIIPVVTFSYLAVLTADNIICAIFDVRDNRDRRRSSAVSTLADEETSSDRPQSDGRTMTMAQIQLPQKHERTTSNDSNDSGRTLHDSESRPGWNNRGYSHLKQDDHDSPTADGDEEERIESPHGRR